MATIQMRGTGMNREEILIFSDNVRRQTNEYIAANPGCNVSTIAKALNLTHHQTRGYLRYLVKQGNITLHGTNWKSHYKTTGKPYETLRSVAELYDPRKDEGIIPGARVIRLLDKVQPALTEYERKERRKARVGMGFGSSSMAMFDGW